VLERVTTQCRNRTLIFITHRTEVLKYADEQIVLGERQ